MGQLVSCQLAYPQVLRLVWTAARARNWSESTKNAGGDNSFQLFRARCVPQKRSGEPVGGLGSSWQEFASNMTEPCRCLAQLAGVRRHSLPHVHGGDCGHGRQVGERRQPIPENRWRRVTLHPLPLVTSGKFTISFPLSSACPLSACPLSACPLSSACCQVFLLTWVSGSLPPPSPPPPSQGFYQDFSLSPSPQGLIYSGYVSVGNWVQ